MTISLADLRRACRWRANMENSQFVSDTELNSYINESGAELHGLLVMNYEDYYLRSLEFTLSGSDDGYDLPTNEVLKLRGVDIQLGGLWQELKEFNMQERNRAARTVLTGPYVPTNLRYQLGGDRIRFQPTTQAAGSYRLWYVPPFTKLVSDSDTVSDIEGWHQYIIIDAAIKMLQKEESTEAASMLMTQKQLLIQRIQKEASNRDAYPQRITDVRMDERWPY